jgi:hypothetical protein
LHNTKIRLKIALFKEIGNLFYVLFLIKHFKTMKYLMLYALLLLTLAGCSSTDPEPNLPPETTTGENTAGFIVDGKTVVLPSNSYSSVPGTGTVSGLSIRTGLNFSSPTDSRYFTIKISNTGSRKTYTARLRLHEHPFESEKYFFGLHNGEYGGDGSNHPQMEVIISGKDIETEWYSSIPNSGEVIFTRVDKINKIYSGAFEATLYGRFDNTKTMKISKGRFDIKLL